MDICKLLMKYREHKDNLIKKNLFSLVPSLSAFDSKVFCNLFLDDYMNYFINLLKKDRDRPSSTYQYIFILI